MSERNGYAPGTPSWVDLMTPDLEASLAFYGGLFGWDLEDAGEEANHYHQAIVRGKRVAGLGPAMEGAPPFAAWTTYLNGTDVDAHAAAIRDAGGQVPFEPIDVMSAGRMLIGMDPGGAAFGIWEPGEHQGAQLVNENATMTWNELHTRDLEPAQSFYGQVFDYTFEDLPGSMAYSTFAVDGAPVGGILGLGDRLPEGAPPYWMTYFHLDDVDAGFQQARDLGGELIQEPVDSPFGRFAPVRDPQGAVFTLIRGQAA